MKRDYKRNPPQGGQKQPEVATCDNCGSPLVPGAAECAACGEATKMADRYERKSAA